MAPQSRDAQHLFFVTQQCLFLNLSWLCSRGDRFALMVVLKFEEFARNRLRPPGSSRLLDFSLLSGLASPYCFACPPLGEVYPSLAGGSGRESPSGYHSVVFAGAEHCYQLMTTSRSSRTASWQRACSAEVRPDRTRTDLIANRIILTRVVPIAPNCGSTRPDGCRC